jgi:hypothetical protein
MYPPRKEYMPPIAKTFVAAGRPIKLKQEAMLRRIFEDVQRRHPDISLDARTLPGPQHRARVASSYAVILASVSDVSPNAIIDAVVNGKPFICTNDTGIKERLANTGLFVDTQDEKVLSGAIESLLQPDEYARVSACVQKFDFVRGWGDLAEDVIGIMKKVCAW